MGNHFYKEITCKQFFLLACMSLFQKHPPTILELANVMGCSHQNVKQMLNKLVEKDYLYIKSDEKDKRKRCICTTEHAIKVGKAYKERQEKFIQMLYDGVTQEEAESTLAVLLKMEDNQKRIEGDLFK